MMRLVIISVDNMVGKDGVFRDGLDLSQCGLPANFWAFQWNEHGNNTGHIEYNSPLIQNDAVTEIPAWATACVAVLQSRLDQEAAEEAAREAARNVAQNESQS
jgi:predicted nicotinamide N-methyase